MSDDEKNEKVAERPVGIEGLGGLRAENLRLRSVIHALTHATSGRAVLVETVWFDLEGTEKPATMVHLLLCAPQFNEREMLDVLLPEMRDLFAKMGVRVDAGKIIETGAHMPQTGRDQPPPVDEDEADRPTRLTHMKRPTIDPKLVVQPTESSASASEVRRGKWCDGADRGWTCARDTGTGGCPPGTTFDPHDEGPCPVCGTTRPPWEEARARREASVDPLDRIEVIRLGLWPDMGHATVEVVSGPDGHRAALYVGEKPRDDDDGDGGFGTQRIVSGETPDGTWPFFPSPSAAIAALLADLERLLDAEIARLFSLRRK